MINEQAATATRSRIAQHMISESFNPELPVVVGRDRMAEFVELYSSHYPRLQFYIMAMLPTANDASDVLQETSLVLWRKFDTFQSGTNFFAWACKIARLQALKHRERQGRTGQLFELSVLEKLAAEACREDSGYAVPLAALQTVCPPTEQPKPKSTAKGLYDLDTILGNELAASGSGQSQMVGGVASVAELLNHVDKANENLIISKIEELNPELADNIRQLMFTFDDLIFVDDRGIQLILREVSNEELTIGLKGAGDEVREKLFKNLSERAAAMIKEDLEAMGPVRLSDVEKAQQNIVRIAKRLEDEGKIIIARGGGGDVFL